MSNKTKLPFPHRVEKIVRLMRAVAPFKTKQELLETVLLMSAFDSVAAGDTEQQWDELEQFIRDEFEKAWQRNDESVEGN